MGDGNVGRVVFGPGRSASVDGAAEISRMAKLTAGAEIPRLYFDEKTGKPNKCADCEMKDKMIAEMRINEQRLFYCLQKFGVALEFYADLANYPVPEQSARNTPQEHSSAMVRNMEAMQKMTLKARDALADVGKLTNG